MREDWLKSLAVGVWCQGVLILPCWSWEPWNEINTDLFHSVSISLAPKAYSFRSYGYDSDSSVLWESQAGRCWHRVKSERLVGQEEYHS